MPHAHEASGEGRHARALVVTVSTSRDASTDRSGPLIRQLLEAAGHTVSRHALVPDDPTAIGEVLDAGLADPNVDLLIFTGGTGVSARDCTPRVVAERLDRPLTGFGELFRWLSYQEIGSAAMLSGAMGGIARGKLVFSLPGSSGACRLGMEKLLLPEVGHLLAELAKESALPVAQRGPAGIRATGGVMPVVRPSAGRSSPTGAPAAGDAAPAKEHTQTILEVVLATLGARLTPGAPIEIPDWIARQPAVMDVLNSAGDRVALSFEDGSRGIAFGYPDVRRPGTKVLVVRPGEPYGEIVAAHRGLQGTGLCSFGSSSTVLPPAETSLAQVTQARTKVAYTGPGELFAVEAAAVYYLDGGKVHRWDGRGSTTLGSPASALASLVLAWSAR